MEKLFVEPCEFEKVGYSLYLEKESAQWVRSIISHFLEQFPMLQNQPISLKWIKKDDARGYAVGAINVLGGSVPVVVKEWQLSPLDIIVMPGLGTMPLTEQFVIQALTNPTAFKKLAPTDPKSNLAMFGELQHSPINSYSNPDGTTSTIREAVKVASFIDNISVDASTMKRVLTQIDGDEEIKQGFINNDNYDVVEKLAGKTPVSKTQMVTEFVRGLEMDRQYVYTDAVGNYHVKQANSNVDYTWEVDASPEEIAKLAKKKCKKSKKHKKMAEKYAKKANSYELVGKNGHFYVNEDKYWHVFDKEAGLHAANNIEFESDVPKIGDTGVFIVGDKATEPFEIYNIEKVSDLEKSSSFKLEDGSFLYLNSENQWFVDDRNDGIAKIGHEIEAKSPEIGDFGIFVIGERATKPFEVVNMQKVAGVANWTIVGFNGLEKVAYMPIRPKMDWIEESDTEKNAFYVPGNAKFVKLGKNIEKTGYSARILDKMVKSASEKAILKIATTSGVMNKDFYVMNSDLDSIRFSSGENMFDAGRHEIGKNAKFVKLSHKISIKEPSKDYYTKHYVSRDSAGLFNLDGPEFQKYGESHDIRSLTKEAAVWAMIHVNVPEEEIAQAEKLEKKSGLALTEAKCPEPINTIYNKVAEAFDNYDKEIKKLSKNLLKEASVLTDKGTVDAVLSLGLMKRHNVAEYVAMIPNYEFIANELAKLLLSARLGMTQVPEDAVKRAMESLVDVLYILRSIQAVNRSVK